MPTTKIRNLIYLARISIPLGIPAADASPTLRVLGSGLCTRDSYIRLLQKHHVLGAATLLRDGSRRLVLLSSSSNPPHSVSESSMFRVASITKMATALAALRAVEERKMSLEEPILSFLPAFPNASELRDITISHLLSHTSGLTDPAGLETSLNEGVLLPGILPGCRINPPGAVFRYSNLGFGLIGSLLESVYDLPVSEIFDRLVFHPLEMNATLSAATLNPSTIVPITRIFPYRPGKDLIMTPLGTRPVTNPDPLRHYGYTAGAMYTDLISLEKMLQCLMRNGSPLISHNLGVQMHRKHADYGMISPSLSYGFGLLRIQDSSVSSSLILGHQGFAYGCVDGAFWEAESGKMVLFLNGGCSEARAGRLGLANRDILRWALRKEMPKWSES